jgi:hypothetical protein
MMLSRLLTLSILVLFLILPAQGSISQILEICPNPYGSDEAEYIKFSCATNCTLSDGEGKIIAGKGMHIAAKNKTAFKLHFGEKADIEFPPRFALSNRGEEICLLDKTERHCFNYSFYLDDGVIYYRHGDGWDFRYEDWSDFECVNDRVRIRLIATPSSYRLPDGYRIASYTFAAEFTPSELFVDASPVGSVPCRELEVENVHFLSSNSYRNFHYKFAVKNESVILTTENWIFAKKGFIVEFSSEVISQTLRRVLENDLRFETSKPAQCSIWSTGEVSGSEKLIEVEADVILFILPDCNPVFDLISSARERLLIMAPYVDFDWYTEKSPLLESIKLAARNGAEVMFVVNGKYADKEEVDKLRAVGANVLFDNRIHGKAIVADDRLLITSANMNLYGLKLNREVGVLISSKKAADFAFESILDGAESLDSINFNSSYNPSYTIPSLIAFILVFLILRRYSGKKL